MLINCPKCGFSQPKDRYCASCGVDMKNFKPIEPAVWKKVLANPFFHVSLIFVLVAVAVVFVRKQQQEDLKARVEYLKGGPVIVEKSNEASSPYNENEANSTDGSVSEANAASNVQLSASADAQSALAGQPTSETPLPQPAKSNSAAFAANSANPASTPESGKSKILHMTVQYAELDRTTLAAWMEEMRASGQLRQFDSVNTGPIAKISDKIKNAKGFKLLQKIERNLDLNNPNYEWFVGTHKGTDPDNEMGLFTSVTTQGDGKDGLTRGEVEIQRAFRDPKDPTKTMERVSFGGPFELTAGSAFLAVGLIPRKFVTDLDDDLNSDRFLSIFKSTAFRNRESEFTLLIEFDTPTK